MELFWAANSARREAAGQDFTVAIAWRAQVAARVRVAATGAVYAGATAAPADRAAALAEPAPWLSSVRTGEPADPASRSASSTLPGGDAEDAPAAREALNWPGRGAPGPTRRDRRPAQPVRGAEAVAPRRADRGPGATARASCSARWNLGGEGAQALCMSICDRWFGLRREAGAGRDRGRSAGRRSSTGLRGDHETITASSQETWPRDDERSRAAGRRWLRSRLLTVIRHLRRWRADVVANASRAPRRWPAESRW